MLSLHKFLSQWQCAICIATFIGKGGDSSVILNPSRFASIPPTIYRFTFAQHLQTLSLPVCLSIVPLLNPKSDFGHAINKYATLQARHQVLYVSYQWKHVIHVAFTLGTPIHHWFYIESI